MSQCVNCERERARHTLTARTSETPYVQHLPRCPQTNRFHGGTSRCGEMTPARVAGLRRLLLAGILCCVTFLFGRWSAQPRQADRASSPHIRKRTHNVRKQDQGRHRDAKDVAVQHNGQCRHGGWWDTVSGAWVEGVAAPDGSGCVPRRVQWRSEQRRRAALTCLKKWRRIVMIGDSVHRGLFWDMVSFVEGLGVNATIVKRFEAERFTNFQDQDVVARDRATGEELFSIRFTYGSNAIDFPSRCSYISQWFFQCLDPMDRTIATVMDQEMEQGSKDERRRPESSSVGLLYLNTGLWDWRTGVPPANYAENVRTLLERSKHFFEPPATDRVVWRTTSASWSSKFMSERECQDKPLKDTRPCSVHTDGTLAYNRLATPIVRAAGVEILDIWSITNGRPDLSFDGLHFEAADCRRHPEKCRGTQDPALVYRILNSLFLDAICPA